MLLPQHHPRLLCLSCRTTEKENYAQTLRNLSLLLQLKEGKELLLPPQFNHIYANFISSINLSISQSRSKSLRCQVWKEKSQIVIVPLHFPHRILRTPFLSPPPPTRFFRVAPTLETVSVSIELDFHLARFRLRLIIVQFKASLVTF